MGIRDWFFKKESVTTEDIPREYVEGEPAPAPVDKGVIYAEGGGYVPGFEPPDEREPITFGSSPSSSGGGGGTTPSTTSPTQVSSPAMSMIPEKTPAQATAEYSQQVLAYRQQQQTYGKNLGYATEFGMLKKGGGVIYPSGINPLTKKPYGTIEAVEEKKGLEGAKQWFQRKRAEVSTASSRRGGGITSLYDIQQTGVGILAGAGTSVLDTAFFTKSLVTKPKETITNIPSSVKGAYQYISSGKLTQTIKSEPAFVTGYVGAEVGQAYVGGKASSFVSEKIGALRTRISPRYAPVTELDTAIKGTTGKGVKGVAGEFDIPFAKSVKEISEPVSKQIKLSGKEIRVVSAQTEAPFLSKKGFKFGELQRELYFDPYGRARVSRIVNVEKEAKLIDVLSGDVSFRKGKPALLTGEFKIETPPASIYQKLKTGKVLTAKETKIFKEFVETPSGKLKPTPKLTKEPEVIFAAGEVPYKKGTLGVTLIEGKRTKIYDVGIKRLPQDLKKSLTSSAGDIMKATTSDIEPTYYVSPTRATGLVSVVPTSKETKISYASYTPVSKPISPKFTSLSFSPKPSQKISPSLPKTSITISQKIISSPIKRQPKTSIPISQITRVPKTTGFIPPLKPTTRTISSVKKAKLPTSSYLVSIRRFGKWKPYTTTPSLRQAFSTGKEYTRTTLGASFKVTGAGRIPKVPRGYYTKLEKGEKIFIEKRGRRLKRGTGEIPEIQFFRKTKRRKK